MIMMIRENCGELDAALKMNINCQGNYDSDDDHDYHDDRDHDDEDDDLPQLQREEWSV